MSTLSTWRFGTTDGAEAALRTLERLQHGRRLSVRDLAVVAWPTAEQRPRTYQVGTANGDAALSGAFWGLLFGVALLLPLTRDGADGGSLRVHARDLSRVGLSDDFLAELRDRIVPGTSALFLLTGDAEVAGVRRALADSGVDELVSTLDRDQEAALHRAFNADDDLVVR